MEHEIIALVTRKSIILYRQGSVRYSPDGEILAIATIGDMIIVNCGTGERVANFKGHTGRNFCLVWTPSGTRLLSGGDQKDLTIRE